MGNVQVTAPRHRYYDLVTQLELQRHKVELQRHQMFMTSLQKNKPTLLLLDEDLEVLERKEDVIIRPLPEKSYCDNGSIRLVVQVCDVDFMKRVHIALTRRGYVDTDESTSDMRIMQRDKIIFVVTTIPQRKHCVSITN